MNARYTKTVLSIFVFFIVMAFSVSLTALDMTVGADVWYAKWKIKYPVEEQSPDNAFFVGPSFSVKFLSDYTFSCKIMFGMLNMDTVETSIDGANTYSHSTSWDIFKYDVDTALSYTLNSYFKVFLGYKYMRQCWEGEGTTYENGVYHESSDSEHTTYYHGPALGIGVTVPVYDRLYLLFNGNGLYLRGQNDKERTRTPVAGPAETSSESLDATGYGFNTYLGLAYYFPDANTTIALGLRYQRLEITVHEEDEDVELIDTFYGITLSAIYFFNL